MNRLGLLGIGAIVLWVVIGAGGVPLTIMIVAHNQLGIDLSWLDAVVVMLAANTLRGPGDVPEEAEKDSVKIILGGLRKSVVWALALAAVIGLSMVTA